MTAQTEFVQPPRIAVWLITLFTPADEAESMLGDLLEEFSQLASKSGVAFARSWYWRQTVKTVAHLVGSGLFVAPWLTVGGVIISFHLIYWVDASEMVIVEVLDRYRSYEYNLDIYRWLADAIPIGKVLAAVLAGSLVAVVAKGREVTATLAVGLCMIAWTGVVSLIAVSLMTVATTGDYGLLWNSLRVYPFSIATVVGGAVIRTRRSAVATRPYAT
jgi:hypothetical protein